LGFIFFIAKRPKAVTGLLISTTEPADDVFQVMLAGSTGLPMTGANHPFPDHPAATQQHQGRIAVGSRSVSRARSSVQQVVLRPHGDKDSQEWPAHAAAPGADRGHMPCVSVGDIHPEGKYVTGVLPFSCVR